MRRSPNTSRCHSPIPAPNINPGGIVDNMCFFPALTTLVALGIRNKRFRSRISHPRCPRKCRMYSPAAVTPYTTLLTSGAGIWGKERRETSDGNPGRRGQAVPSWPPQQLLGRSFPEHEQYYCSSLLRIKKIILRYMGG